MIAGILGRVFKNIVHQLNQDIDSNYENLLNYFWCAEDYPKLTRILFTEDEELFAFAKDLIDLYKEDKDELDDKMRVLLKSEAHIVMIQEFQKQFFTKPTFSTKLERIWDFFAS